MCLFKSLSYLTATSLLFLFAVYIVQTTLPHVIPTASFLNKESKDIPVSLSLLNQTSTKVVSSSPLAELPNILRVQTNGLSADFVQFIIPKRNFGSIDGRREYSKFGL
jgi:hypothetical protein